MSTTTPIALAIDPGALRPLIDQAIEAALAKAENARAALPDRLAYSEPEAARLMGLNPHVLRDVRLRGEINASQIVGRRIRYLRSDLVDYLMKKRTNSN